MNPPSGLVVRFSREGLISYLVDSEDVMISRLMVLMPMLANRMISTMMIAREKKPPVAVVYSGSPLYLRSWLLGSRSANLRYC